MTKNSRDGRFLYTREQSPEETTPKRKLEKIIREAEEYRKKRDSQK